MMASPMLKLITGSLFHINYQRVPFNNIVRHLSEKKKTFKGTKKYRNLIASSCESLAARGFLRSYKPYTPVENVRNIVLGFCNKVLGDNFDQTMLLSKEDKFTILNSCFEELNHSVPNSLLYKVVNVKDIIEFYETPVSTTVPYDELSKQDLPPNLHIQAGYLSKASNILIKKKNTIS